MSNFPTTEDGTKKKHLFSLTKAAEDVSQHGYAQTEALREAQRTLQALQANLSEVEKKGEMAEQELRTQSREFLMLEAKLEHLKQQIQVMHDCYSCIRKENTELQIGISEAGENACMALTKFNTYRNKMDGHRVAVLNTASQTEARRQLEEKRALVRMLTQKKKELKEDLEDPNGNTVQMAKSKIDALKQEISVVTETLAEKRDRVQRELKTQTQIKKEIEVRHREEVERLQHNLQINDIQNKRYEAIIKRLHCQLSRAQAVHRQMSEDVDLMERQLARLKEQLEDTADSGH